MPVYNLDVIIDLEERSEFALGLVRAGELSSREIETNETTQVFAAIFDAIWTKLKPISDALEREERKMVAANNGGNT